MYQSKTLDLALGLLDVLHSGNSRTQKSHTAENETSVPYSRIFVYAATGLVGI